MKKALSLCFVVALLVLPMTHGYGQDATTKEEAFAASVKLLFEKLTAAVLAGDVESWILLWDKDAIQMPDDSLPIEGIDNIKITQSLFFRKVQYKVFDIRIAQTHVDENIGYAYGTFRFLLFYKSNGVKVSRYLKFATIFKKQSDESWRIVLDIASLNIMGG